MGYRGDKTTLAAPECRGLWETVTGRAQWGVGCDLQGSPLTHPVLPPSSSEAEPDCRSSEASSAQPHEESPRRPETPPFLEPLSRHSSLREVSTRKVSPRCPEESQAVHGEQGACLGGGQACLVLANGEGTETPHSQFFTTEDPVTGPALGLTGSRAGV